MASATRSAPVDRRPSPRAPKASTPAVSVTPASITRRLIGGAIDALLILMISGAIWTRLAPPSVPVQVRIDASTGERIVIDQGVFSIDWMSLIAVIVAAVYLIGFIALWGRTPGGWAVRIRCIDASTGGRPGFVIATKRWLILLGIPTAVGLIPILGTWAWLLTLAIALSPLMDRTGAMQGVHDRFAGDLVVLDRP